MGGGWGRTVRVGCLLGGRTSSARGTSASAHLLSATLNCHSRNERPRQPRVPRQSEASSTIHRHLSTRARLEKMMKLPAEALLMEALQMDEMAFGAKTRQVLRNSSARRTARWYGLSHRCGTIRCSSSTPTAPRLSAAA